MCVAFLGARIVRSLSDMMLIDHYYSLTGWPWSCIEEQVYSHTIITQLHDSRATIKSSQETLQDKLASWNLEGTEERFYAFTFPHFPIRGNPLYVSPSEKMLLDCLIFCMCSYRSGLKSIKPERNPASRPRSTISTRKLRLQKKRNTFLRFHGSINYRW